MRNPKIELTIVMKICVVLFLFAPLNSFGTHLDCYEIFYCLILRLSKVRLNIAILLINFLVLCISLTYLTGSLKRNLFVTLKHGAMLWVPLRSLITQNNFKIEIS